MSISNIQSVFSFPFIIMRIKKIIQERTKNLEMRCMKFILDGLITL